MKKETKTFILNFGIVTCIAYFMTTFFVVVGMGATSECAETFFETENPFSVLAMLIFYGPALSLFVASIIAIVLTIIMRKDSPFKKVIVFLPSFVIAMSPLAVITGNAIMNFVK